MTTLQGAVVASTTGPVAQTTSALPRSPEAVSSGATAAPSANQKEKLRIGLLAPPWFAVPPTGYGGIERVVSYLAEGLVAAGHDVTLFASGGSTSAARVVSAFDTPPSSGLGDLALDVIHTTSAYRMVRSFDVMHDHTLAGLAAAVLSPTPVVHTMHGPIGPAFARLYSEISPSVGLVAISDHQRSTLPAGTSATVIHNGIDLGHVPFSDAPGEHLLFVGRMNPEKGILDAIEIARRARQPLVIVAKVNERPERDYFETMVRPALRGIDAELLFQPAEEVKLRAYQEARATLFPVRWPEPFGLVMIESMATGTPVIAFRDGSVPEVIVDGKTGFISDDVEQAVEAVSRLDEIDRGACRAHVAANFGTDVAVRRHEVLFRATVGLGSPGS